MKNTELIDAVKDFLKIVDKLEDNPKNVLTVSNFLRNFIRIRVPNSTQPTTEIVTIIKHRLPNIFTLIRKQRAGVLGILIDLEMDYEQAKENLEKFVNS